MADNTYGNISPAAPLRVTSPDFEDGSRLPDVHASSTAVAGGEHRSPALEWADSPEGTKSYAITCWDPDAPSGAGFWHWAVFNIPATVTSLPAGAGTPESTALPAGAVTLKNDAGVAGYYGCEPPVGHGEHHYIFAVHALDFDLGELQLGLPTPTMLGLAMNGHTLARGLITGTWSR